MNFWCFLFLAFNSVEFHFYKKKLSSNGHLKSSNGYICVQIIRVVLGFSLNDFVLADEQFQPFLLRYGCHCSRAIFWLGKWLHCWSMVWCVLEPKFGFASTAGDALTLFFSPSVLNRSPSPSPTFALSQCFGKQE